MEQQLSCRSCHNDVWDNRTVKLLRYAGTTTCIPAFGSQIVVVHLHRATLELNGLAPRLVSPLVTSVNWAHRQLCSTIQDTFPVSRKHRVCSENLSDEGFTCLMNGVFHNRLVAPASRLADESPTLPSHYRQFVEHRTPPRSAVLYKRLSPGVCDTATRQSDLHILPRRLCKIRILASSSSAMVQGLLLSLLRCIQCWFIISVYECRLSGGKASPTTASRTALRSIQHLENITGFLGSCFSTAVCRWDEFEKDLRYQCGVTLYNRALGSGWLCLMGLAQTANLGYEYLDELVEDLCPQRKMCHRLKNELIRTRGG